MRAIKILGLAMVAALATMAMFGAASASGAEALCKVENTTPCPPEQQYSLPQTIESKLVSGTTANLYEKNSSQEQLEPPVECKKSEVSGTATEKSGEQILGKITSASWTECTREGRECPKVKALQLPWSSHLNQKEPFEQNNGTLWVGEQPGAGQPGAEIKCKTIIGEVTCNYKVKELQSGYAGEWAKLQVSGGNPAKIKAEVQLKRSSGSGFFCFNVQGIWKAEYEVIKPKPLYISTQ